MQNLSGFTFVETLREAHGLILLRARPDGDPSATVLVLTSDSEHSSASAAVTLEHEYALREQIDGETSVRPLSLNRSGGRAVLVLQDPGGSLLGKSDGIDRFLTTAIALTKAIASIHASGLIHRDIKPANVVLDATGGKPWITGFGFAGPARQVTDSSPESITGTLAYMAPEQTGRTHGTVDSRSDLYSLGITFYEMLAGVPPFTATDPLEMIHCHVARAPAPFAEHTDAVPLPLASIVMKLLEKDADHRYQTAFGLTADLETCLVQWLSNARIDPFELATRDAPSRLKLKDKLYGRDKEVERLAAAYERICAGSAPEFILVTGAAGIGKSALVQGLNHAITRSGGILSCGKFDKSKSDVPHSLVAQAFQAQILQILYKPENEVAQWRQAFLSALGDNAQLMIDLIPELEHVVGKQAPAIALPATEAKKRFHRTFLQLLGVFADAAHPLVLFLDDLQFIDGASVELLEAIFGLGETRHFALIVAYRDNEIASGHPLQAMLERIDSSGRALLRLVLQPLLQDDVAQLLSDAMNCTPERARELGAAVFQKTEGNLFFTTQFVNDISEEKLIAFDTVGMEWNWDLRAIRDKGFSDNVVDIMAAKISRLPDAAKAILKQIACFGNSVEVAMLSMVMDRSVPLLHDDLAAAVSASFLVRAGDVYKFSHDRIQQATYALIPEDDRAGSHLEIGRTLVSQLDADTIQKEIFPIVYHLNLGKDKVVDAKEKALLRSLNLCAGRKAKASTAFAVAREHLALAAEFITPATWKSDYQDTISLYFELLECEYLVGNFDRSDDISKIILRYARDSIDSAKVYELRMRLYQLAGKLEEAINAGLDALKLFDVHFPETEEALQAECEKEKPNIAINLAGRSVAQLVNEKPTTDPIIRTMISLMVDLGPCLAVVRPKSKLYALLVLKIINLSLAHGSVEKSCFIFAQYGRMLITDAGNVAAGMEFADLAMQLNEKLGDVKLKGTLGFFRGAYLHHWRASLSSNVEVLEQALQACVEVGNYVFAGNAAYFIPTHRVAGGASLDEIIESCDKYLAFARKINNNVLHQGISLYRELVSSLYDRPSGDVVDAQETGMDERFATHAAARFAPSIAGYYTLKQTVCFLLEQYAEAESFGESATKVMAPGGVAFTSYFFYFALTRMALHRQSGGADLEATLEAIEVSRQKLKFMAESSPGNYLNRHALVEAEVAGLEGRVLDAQTGYEDAIRSARDNGFVQNEALAHELAGKFHLQRGLETIGYAYLRESHSGYARWGATRKSRQLEQSYPRLATSMRLAKTANADATSGNLDVMSVVKASQALSSEILLEKVIERLMTIVLETAGAVRGLLILPLNGAYSVAAEASTGHQITVTPRESAVTSSELPVSIFQYVVRTSECVLLDDASSSALYVGDEYVTAHRAKSVLFLPLIKQGNLVGVLYLENNLIAGAFTAERMTILKMLNSQAAISVENARLYRERELAEKELMRHRDHLGELVEERTAVVKQKTNDIEAMLQNMDLGVCTVVSDNSIHPEYSKHLRVIFEEDDFAGRDVLQSLFSKSNLGADSMDQISEALKSIIGEDRMMFDFNSHLLVSEMELLGVSTGKKIVKMDWSPIVNEFDIVEKVLCISQDVTQLRELELASEQQRQELDIISRIIKVAAGKFNEFVGSTHKFIADNRAIIASGDAIDRDAIAVLFRNMHTIKGNSRTYDFTLITDAAHTAEQYYDELRSDVTNPPVIDRLLLELLGVEQALGRYTDVNEDKLGRKGRGSDLLTARGVFVPNDVIADLKSMSAALRNPEGNDAILTLRRLIRQIGIIPLDRLVGGSLDSLSSLVKELGKPMPEVDIKDGDVGFTSQFAEALKVSFMHIVRNCMDHGIEAPADRVALHKSAAGTIRFACVYREGKFELHIGDDGRGLALHRLYEKGVTHGLIQPSPSPLAQEVAELIFNSGLSTAEQVTQVSGRGVGMDAVRATLAEHGADIRVALDAPSQGITFAPFKFVIRVPAALVTA